MGHLCASELLLLGESFDATKAATLGLVNAVVADTALDDYVERRLARLTEQPPAALRRSKALLKQAPQMDIEAALAAEFTGFAEGLQSDECKEAIAAFFEKRAPDFSRFQ
jgi:enoyl-CoA hydratase/carnithine racemase